MGADVAPWPRAPAMASPRAAYERVKHDEGAGRVTLELKSLRRNARPATAGL